MHLVCNVKNREQLYRPEIPGDQKNHYFHRTILFAETEGEDSYESYLLNEVESIVSSPFYLSEN